MSRNIQIIGDVVRVVELSPQDLFFGPLVDPPEVSFITEADWLALVGAPDEGETFEQRELAYVVSMGWKMEGI